jgi:hypothetical protein
MGTVPMLPAGDANRGLSPHGDPPCFRPATKIGDCPRMGTVPMLPAGSY